MESAIAMVAESPWASHLILRGSILMRAWVGDRAREPGDLDFVVTPATQQVDSAATSAMLASLTERLLGRQIAPGICFAADGARMDAIWTYERVPGRRVVVPWESEGTPSGSLQMDFVFQEPLPAPPVEMQLPRLDGRSIVVCAASRELSLAWKLKWLITDTYPQGKDLYDAVLLAEQQELPPELLKAALGPDLAYLQIAFEVGPHRQLPWNLRGTEWDSFQAEYPWVGGTLEEWVARLLTATNSAAGALLLEESRTAR
jgi:hypothetical protein